MAVIKDEYLVTIRKHGQVFRAWIDAYPDDRFPHMSGEGDLPGEALADLGERLDYQIEEDEKEFGS